jgi:Ca2+-binding RTX toxin-like protein
MGAEIEAEDGLGAGLDMSDFTNGVGFFKVMGDYEDTVTIPRSDYDDAELEGSGPYYADFWSGGSKGMENTIVVWKDAGSDIFVAHVVFLDEEGIPTAGLFNIDVVVDDSLLDGGLVKVTFLKGDDEVFGNRYDDILKGGDGKDFVFGDGGNDKLYGENGNDTIEGGTGKDSLFGGSGRDAFVFDSGSLGEGADRISDFSVKDDTIHLGRTAFSELSEGKLNKAAFAANTTGNAADSSDRIIYETDTGKVFYDEDGKGGVGRVHIATLSPDLNLTQADFLVV